MRRVFKININSSFRDGFLYCNLYSLIMTARVNIKNIFMNSLGWKLPIPGIVNQHLLLLIGVPKKSNNSNKIHPRLYKKIVFSY